VEARVADRTSGDLPVDVVNGASEGQHNSRTRVSDQAPSEAAQASFDGDQTSADGDELTPDDDHVGSDLASDDNRAARRFSRDIRQRTARQREHSARARLDAAAERDQAAQVRDLAALARDQDAAARDLAVARRSAADERDAGARAVTGAEIVVRAAAERKRAAQRRAQAAEHHALAAQDRLAAAKDREHAAGERRQARADREALARQVAIVETDALTGARPREAGLSDLDHELERCSRSSGLLVVVYVDVVAAKALDDSQHHSAVDELLRRAIAHIHEHLRCYDLIVRLGETEFLCAMSNMTLPAARQRFGLIGAAIGADAIATGFAVLTSHEGASELIARADSDLIAARRTLSTIHHSPPTT
jgi:diguanylate cyclase (GGDEF)-like protein